tara:strand:- start:4132 stop:4689 length:558 start_codon:yes stop_codon:yes gene_type:complete
MIKFLGLLSKKKKVKPVTAASIYVAVLNNVISEGFIEIKNFINNNNNLEVNPNLDDAHIDWFSNVIFLGNMKNLDLYFEEEEASVLRALILDEMYKDFEDNAQHLAIERFLDYENYFKDLLVKHEFPISAMAHAIFEKYNINDFQGDLFKKKNKPNPVFLNELKNLLGHFIWNWKEYLEKNKLVF